MYRVNVVDPSRRSTTYEQRLIKYARRGFAIGVANLNLEDVDQTFLQQLHANGVARSASGLLALLLEHYYPSWDTEHSRTLYRARKNFTVDVAQDHLDDEIKKLTKRRHSKAAVASLAAAAAAAKDFSGGSSGAGGRSSTDAANAAELNLLADDAYDLILHNEDYSWFPSSGSLHPLMLEHLWAAAARAALPEARPRRRCSAGPCATGSRCICARSRHYIPGQQGSDRATARGGAVAHQEPGRAGSHFCWFLLLLLLRACADADGQLPPLARGRLWLGEREPVASRAHLLQRLLRRLAFFFRCICLRRDRVRQLVGDSVREGLSVENRAYLEAHSVDLVVDYLLLEEMHWSSEEENLQKEAAGKERSVQTTAVAVSATTAPPLPAHAVAVASFAPLHALLYDPAQPLFVYPRAAFVASAVDAILQQQQTQTQQPQQTTLSPLPEECVSLLSHLTVHHLSTVLAAMRSNRTVTWRRLGARGKPADRTHMISSRDVQTAVRHMRPFTLAKRAVMRGVEAVSRQE
jgi:hypothetical protein